MSKRSISQQVPKDMQTRFDDITRLTDDFSQTYLTDEYASLCRELTATLCRKRPSPLSQGKASYVGVWDHPCGGHGELSLRCLTDTPRPGKPDSELL